MHNPVVLFAVSLMWAPYCTVLSSQPWRVYRLVSNQRRCTSLHLWRWACFNWFMGKKLLDMWLEYVLSAMTVGFPMDGELHELVRLWLEHHVFVLLGFVFLSSSNATPFGSPFLVTVTTANTYKQAASCSAQSLCFPVIPMCAGLAPRAEQGNNRD